MDPLEAIRLTFFEECAELLESLEAGLLDLQAGTQGPDTIDAVFRAVHSIKGGAGAFDLGTLVAFAHEFETALDALRSGRIQADAASIPIFFAASDRLGDLVRAFQAGGAPALPDTADLSALTGSVPVGGEPAGTADDAFAPIMLDFGLDPISDDAELEDSAPLPPVSGPHRRWEISFEPLPDLLLSGNEPLHLFRALEVLGHLKVSANDADLPTLTQMEPQVPRLRWALTLDPTAPDLTETEIESVFEFAVDLCVLDIKALDAPPPLPDIDLSAPTPDIDPPGPAPVHPIPEVPTLPNAEPPAPPVATTIRVDLARVDRLVNLVGELVISQSMLAQGMARADLDQNTDAASNLDDLQQLTRDMQDSVMAIRAQPVKSLFQRMTRIVRETAQATGKDVRLVTEGEGTEIDKTVVERLADPLTHMIRNAIDHGLESPGERERTGKPPTGIVRLTARQQSDRVVIEIADDGRGVDRARVLARAIERGLVPPDRVLEDAEIDRLLFKPGFSTSEKVSNLSGRGVGMDVVQRAIRDLNGTILIDSTPLEGCSVSISLPLTLAILDGMIVRANRNRMVIPLSAILETQTFGAARIETLEGGKQVAQLQDRFVPLVDLESAMGFPPGTPPLELEEDRALMFVQPDEGGPFALRVDAIEAQRQVVIKGLGQNFGHVPCVSAATILGDGQVALIVDPAGIARTMGTHHRSRNVAIERMAS